MTVKSERRSAATNTAGHSGRKRLGFVQRAPGAIDLALSTTRTLVSHLPATMRATRVRANATTSALQILPDSTLQGLAASSVGFGAGFYLAGVPRLVTVAAVAPAMIIGAAIILRPGDRVSRSEAAR
jgi:hypothetical protein